MIHENVKFYLCHLPSWSTLNHPTTIFCFCGITYMSFWELNIAYPNGGQWAPFGYVLPLPVAQTSSYATGCFVFHFLYARGALSTTFSSYRAATLSPNIQGCKCPFALCGRPNLQYTVRFGYTTFRSGRFRHGTFRSRNFCIFGTDEIC